MTGSKIFNMQRIYERDTDRIFIAALRRDQVIGVESLKSIGVRSAPVKYVRAQTRHVGSTGTIDMDVTFGDVTRLMVENKIDAGYRIIRAADQHRGFVCGKVWNPTIGTSGHPRSLRRMPQKSPDLPSL